MYSCSSGSIVVVYCVNESLSYFVIIIFCEICGTLNQLGVNQSVCFDDVLTQGGLFFVEFCNNLNKL